MSTEANPYRFRMVVALDLSEYAEIVLEHALDQAARHDAVELHLLAVQEEGTIPSDEVKGRLTALVADELETFGVLAREGWRAHLHVRCGKPAEEIATLAGEVGADLIVVGRFGVHGATRRFHVGSVAEQVLRHAPCPTLVVQLVDRGAEPPSCPACVAVRRDSDGERWFCDQHHSDRWALATIRFPIASGWERGGPMW
jgi:nucleotide-binding universal stress UspA family protein